MTGLIIKLAPGERVLVNGAVIENGDRRAKLAIRTPNANILRLKDAIHPEKATTPVARLCCTVQMVLAGDLSAAEVQRDLLRGIEELSQVFTDRDSRNVLDAVTQAAVEGNHYRVLRQLRTLIGREARLLAHAS